MSIPATPRRRWFSFSLRTGFALLTLFCVWLGVQVKWIRDRHDALTHYSFFSMSGEPETKAPWSIRMLGESGQYGILEGHQSDEEHKRLETLFPEATWGFIPLEE